jgi:cell division inhibitor SepF
MKKTMAYLGLVDDDYDDYDDYEPRSTGTLGRSSQRRVPDDEPPPSVPTTNSRIRTLTRDDLESSPPVAQHTPSIPRSPSVRPINSEAAGARVHIVAPVRFSDAQEIANRLMGNQPVIVNLQNADRDLQRRMIDFCSGVTYALSGSMERVADEVFLLTPSNVKVSEEERQRLTERGLVNP